MLRYFRLTQDDYQKLLEFCKELRRLSTGSQNVPTLSCWMKGFSLHISLFYVLKKTSKKKETCPTSTTIVHAAFALQRAFVSFPKIFENRL